MKILTEEVTFPVREFTFPVKEVTFLIKEVTSSVKEVAFLVKEVTFPVKEVTFPVKEMFSSNRYFTSSTRKVKYLVSFFRPFWLKIHSKNKKHQSQALNPAKIFKTCYLTFIIKLKKTALI